MFGIFCCGSVQKYWLTSGLAIAIGLIAYSPLGAQTAAPDLGDDPVEPGYPRSIAANAVAQGQPPQPFSLKYPRNGATDIAPTATLRWHVSKGAKSYSVYLFGGNFPSSPSYFPVATGITHTSYTPGILGGGKHYAWAVVANNEFGSTFADGTNHFQGWTFTAGPGVNPGVAFDEFRLPTPNSRPVGITFEGGSTYWIAESATGRIAKVTGFGDTIEEYTTPTPLSGPYAITWHPGIAGVWFTELWANKIGRILSGVITEYPIPTPSCTPQSIVATSSGVWFTENTSNKIGRITAEGVITEYVIPGTRPTAITSDRYGSDNSPLWFAEAGSNKIVRLDPTTGRMIEYAIPTPNANPQSITVGFGFVWFTETQTNKIGRLDPMTGVITEYLIPTRNANPQGITAGRDAIWFAEFTPNKIGRITSDGIISEYSVPTLKSGPMGITGVWFEWERNELWFTEYLSSEIGRAVPL